ncbi:BTAD domain-containing putative transcriptional regulator [Amycolatopsis cihanbeyliensis]|uniref:Putative ATPase n=1 Tax=Amycolatopsis cihanbeyliensis TaxID=1128664 RepID=A0A542DS17_AMYCI|nr:BTAD domain-containing putative transcriptional regulator [Amycolatopsis cihanbeyliensis]TQJ05923.1 putative ATPase [Amycolatopsis cihanbeyliensis]
MRFGVLGPLEVWTDDGTSVRVPELKVRALLADLLVHQGRPVSADRLTDDLWGAKQPSNPANVLQSKVWQLRRALEKAEPGGRELVVSRPPGYLLEVDSGAVDAGRFQDLTARVQATADPRAKAALLADALALWRGPPFVDFGDEEFSRSEIARLEERRLTALEEQAETRLELGEHGLLADEMGDLVTQHPLRERLRTAHVRALYRAGRQSEALNSYCDLRDRLAEELGLDPRPELAALYQAILEQDPALEAVPSPVTTAARPPTNLPAPLTDLIGRDGETAEVRATLDARRLVTLTGPGGVGKTRVAVETATQLVDTFPDGVWLAEFAALDPSALTEVAEVVAAVLGVRDHPPASPVPMGPSSHEEPTPLTEWLVGVLHNKRLLLVLDNCEHAIEPVAKLSELLLRNAPGLRILATSQEPLGISGEQVRVVPPLELPSAAEQTESAALHRFSAVQLFVARAAAASGFTLDADNSAAVAAICQRLDGIPLALEMAATRVRALGVHELAARLDDRFHLLATGERDAPQRQRTLRAIIDWSWELLGDKERAVLRRLAVHSDGCTLAAAEELCATDGTDGTEVLDLLARLVDCSLVVMTDGTEGPRYRLLESVAAYCVERLEEAGELETIRLRHRRYYLDLAERAEPHLHGHAQRQWLRRLDAETANLRSALEGLVQQGDAVSAVRLANALTWYWNLRGRHGEAWRSLTTALSVEGEVPAAARAKATAWQAGFRLLIGGGGTDPVEERRAALQQYDEIDDPGGLARAELFLGSSLYGIGDLSVSEDLMDRALAAFRVLGDRWGTAAVLSTRSFQAKLRGDFAALKRNGEQSLALFRELGDHWGQLQAIAPLATLAEVMGDYEQAGRLHRDALRIAEDFKLWPEVSFTLSGLGRIALLTRNYVQAREFHERARRLAIEQSDKFGEQFAEIGLGLGARREGKFELAETHFRDVLELHRQMGYEPSIPSLILAELGFIAELRGDLEAARTAQLDGLTAALGSGDPRSVALALEGLAGVQAAAGHPGHAARLLGAGAAARESVGAPLPAGERGDVDRVTAKAEAIIGADAFAAEFERGRELDPDEYLSDPHTVMAAESRS